MLAIILAATMWYADSWTDQYGITRTDFWSVDMAERNQLLSPQSRLLEREMIRRPELQREYQFPDDESYPLRTVLPSQRRIIPLEEQLAMEEVQTQRTRDQLAISGAQLNQKIAQANFGYDQNIINQSNEALPLLGTLQPGSGDFEAQAAELQKSKPLAFQNPAFRQSFDRLQQTHIQLQETNTRQRDQLRGVAAKLGEQGLAVYDTAIAEGKDPLEAIATVSSIGASMDAAAKREQQLNSFRENIAKSGDIEALSSFNRILEAAGANADPYAAYVQAVNLSQSRKPPITRADYNTYASRLGRLQEKAGIEDLSAEEQGEVQFLQDSINSFINYQRESQGLRPSPSPTPSANRRGLGDIFQ